MATLNGIAVVRVTFKMIILKVARPLLEMIWCQAIMWSDSYFGGGRVTQMNSHISCLFTCHITQHAPWVCGNGCPSEHTVLSGPGGGGGVFRGFTPPPPQVRKFARVSPQVCTRSLNFLCKNCVGGGTHPPLARALCALKWWTCEIGAPPPPPPVKSWLWATFFSSQHKIEVIL